MSNEVPDGFVDGTDLIDGISADCDALAQTLYKQIEWGGCDGASWERVGPGIRAHWTQVAERLAGAGVRQTADCSACKGSGLYPNPTGVFYAPTEWLGCPDCMGTGRVFPSDSGAEAAVDLDEYPDQYDQQPGIETTVLPSAEGDPS